MLRTLILLILAITPHLVLVTSFLQKSDKTIAYCPVGTRAYGVKLSQVDSRLAEAKLYCKATSDGTEDNAVTIGSHAASPAVQSAGWSCGRRDKDIFCPPGGFIVGYQLYRTDAGLISDMRLYCSNHPFTDYAEKRYYWQNHNGAKWRKTLRCAFGKVVCGMRTHVIKNTAKNECYGETDQLRIACCDRL